MVLFLAVGLPLAAFGIWKVLGWRLSALRAESRITFVAGVVNLTSGGASSRPAVRGEVVPEGTALVTERRSEVDVGFGGGDGGLKITGGSQVNLIQLNGWSNAKEIEVKAGTIYSKVTPRKGKPRYRLKTPSGQIMVRGTGFFAEVGKISTLVATRDGVVEVSLNGNASSTVKVGAGEMVRMAPGSMGKVGPVSPRERAMFARLNQIRELNEEGGVEPAPLTSVILKEGKPGKVVTVALPGGGVMNLGYCPPGSFTMGSPVSEADRGVDEGQVEVRISKGFWMGQTEVTQGQWEALMGKTLAQQKAIAGSTAEIIGLGAAHPMYFVNWNDAQEFVGKMNEKVPLPAGWMFSLPSEAQWEYACRAGSREATAFGKSLDSTQANFRGNFPYRTGVMGPNMATAVEAGSYAPNAWLLYDMHGNVSEWCDDFWSDKLAGGVDPRLSVRGDQRVFRGGSWFNSGFQCRSAKRWFEDPGKRIGDLGFRVAITPREG